ncbi:MAG TPA: hypothetical protein HA330_00820 [Candidatus Thalassarchaeaceae archaeon]|nr:MAG TPA: hypothetical protein D7H85_00825 [Candidatus Poseidoniales archaeon]HII48405.1 hypothetical protein [Candidatus Thalassarchaeaceae archaeon]
MARLSKAKRVKRRWVGLRIKRELDRESLESQIQNLIPGADLRLYDLRPEGDSSIAIMRVYLPDLPHFRAVLAECEWIETLTTSGKIRLVRERLSIPKPPRRR